VELQGLQRVFVARHNVKTKKHCRFLGAEQRAVRRYLELTLPNGGAVR